MDSHELANDKKIEIKQIKLSNIFKDIKSRLILQKIFKHLVEKKLLYIVKYNKNIKSKININIKDYKNYYEKIEIEIIPVSNEYGKFINIKKEDEKYYHIYFDDNKEEIQRNYLDKNDNVSKIKIIIDYQIKSFEELFEVCECIEYLCFKKFYRNNVTNMSCMFDGCSKLKELNLNNFNIIM